MSSVRPYTLRLNHFGAGVIINLRIILSTLLASASFLAVYPSRLERQRVL